MKLAHFVGAGAGVGTVGVGIGAAGADAGAVAGKESRTDPPPVLVEDISASMREVAIKIPADQAVRRESSVAAPRAPNAV